MTHTHAVDRETGPQCCKDGVSYKQRCSCGCVRTRCTCTQCYSNWGNHTGDWSMPKCSACGYHHPQDKSCTNKSQRLMAAAPDLLVALRQLMEWEGYDGGPPGNGHDEDTDRREQEVWQDAQEAIAKATGGRERAYPHTSRKGRDE